MFEGERGAADDLSLLPAEQLLMLAVDRLLTQVPVELPGPVALERLKTLTTSLERLTAARLAGVRDLDCRELYALDGAGSTRGWLRAQPGGDQGQLTLARRLATRPHVDSAHRTGQLATRAVAQLCTALETIPPELDDAVVRATLQHGIGELLRAHRGGTAPDTDDQDRLVAHAADDQAVLDACGDNIAAAPAARLEPAFVLLARRLPAGLLGWALRTLIDPLLPDGTDSDTTSNTADPYYLELRPLLDGDVDLRGHLDAETGLALAAEIDRRLAAARANAASAADAQHTDAQHTGELAEANGTADTDASNTGTAAGGDHSGPAEPGGQGEPSDGFDAFFGPHLPHSDPGPVRLLTAGRRRLNALKALLHDLSAIVPGSGQPRPAQLTITASMAAVEGRLGALPGLLTTSRQPAPMRTATLQRLGCHSELTVVLLAALGNPVGASGTHRNATRRERRALRAQWGATCAVAGCPNTQTIPHHAVPWWLARRTRLRDLVPLCEHCHHDLHEGHRTLRLRNGRHIDDHGWTTAPATSSPAASKRAAA
jgi:hypothetical protein